MSDFTRLQAQLGRVRRRWKRTQALAGLAIVLVEAIGIFTVLLLANWIYRPAPPVRLAMSLGGLVGIAAMVLRHVIAPLFRRISDDQLALYVEEHNDRYEGALMTAAEFGRKSALPPEQAALVQAVVAEAASRAEKTDPRRSVALARLAKYGALAASLLGAYAAAAIAFREHIAEPAQHVLTPWRITESEIPSAAPVESRELPPIAVAFSAATPALRPDGTIRIPRGGSVEMEVSLSRPSDQPVALFYRTAGASAQTKFQRMEMAKIERLNSFGVKLTDVDGDVELYAATGPFESPRHQINVYDPIAVSGYEVGVKYPEYLKLADRLETLPGGDVTAPVGAAASVRILTNRPLKSGKIVWDDGREDALSLDPAKETTALAQFPVTADRSYAFLLEDIDSQQYKSETPALVHAVRDEPPTVAMNSPAGTVMVHPVGGVSFVVETSDDFGLDGVELVYMAPTDDTAKETRVPLVLPKREGPPQPGRVATTCRYRLALEELRPRPQPGGMISYFVEARDRNPNNRPAVTDLGFVYVRPYETWASLALPETPEPLPPPEKSLEELLKAVWNLHRQKPQLAAEEFRKQAEQWTKWMEDPSGAVLKLVVLPHGMAMTPTKQIHLDKGNEYCRQAHDALAQADTANATKYLRLAMAEQAMVGLQEEMLAQIAQPNATDATGQPDATAAAAHALKRMEVEVAKLDAPEKKAANNDRAAAEAAKQQTAQIKKDQEAVIQKAQTAATSAPKPESKPAGEHPELHPEPQPAQPPEAAPADRTAGLAAEQTALAAKTKATADTLRKESVAPKLGEVAAKLDDAARKMTKAAEEFKANRVEKAVTTAKEARMELAAAETQLDAAQQGGIDAALDNLQAQAQRLLQHQQELRDKVEETGKQLHDSDKPNTQQDRDMKTAVTGQVRLKAELNRLVEGLAELDRSAKDNAGRETAKFIAEANRDMKRGRPDQKMTNAVIELTENKPAAAAKEQKTAEAALEKVISSLAAAEGTLASDWKAEARRAQREAQSIEKAVAKLGTETKPEAKGDPSPQAEPSAAARKESAEQAAIDAARLAKHVQARDFAEPSDREALTKAAASPSRLAAGLIADDQARAELAAIARRINNKIEAEIQAKIDAEKLLSAQREACPPQYRDMVNKYYEALSNVKK